MIASSLPGFVVELRDGSRLQVDADAMVCERNSVRFLDEGCEEIAVFPLHEIRRAYRSGAVAEAVR